MQKEQLISFISSLTTEEVQSLSNLITDEIIDEQDYVLESVIDDKGLEEYEKCKLLIEKLRKLG